MPAIDFDNQLMKQEKVLQCLISYNQTASRQDIETNCLAQREALWEPNNTHLQKTTRVGIA